MYVYSVYYVYINTHAVYIFVFLYYKYIDLIYKHDIFILNICMHVFVFIYT